MSLSSNKTKQKSQQSSTGTSTTTVDPWSKAQFENQTTGLLDLAQNYAAKPFKSYDKQMVAGLSPEQQKARQMAEGNIGNYQGLLNDSEAAAKEGLNYDFSNVSKFYNPYEKELVDTSGAYYDEQLGKRMSENQAAAQQQGAYGGSRHGIADAELQRTSNMDRAQMMSDLRYKTFTNAQEMAKHDAANKYLGAGVLGGLAAQKQQFGQNDVAMMEQMGATSREVEQAKLLAGRAEFDREAKDELDKMLLELQTRQGILSSTPMGQTTTSSGTGSSSGTTTSTGFKFAPNFTTPIGNISFGSGGT